MLKPRLKSASELSVKAFTRLCNSQTCFYPEELLKLFAAASGYILQGASEKHILLMKSKIESKLLRFSFSATNLHSI